jgi:hypothetical protein
LPDYEGTGPVKFVELEPNEVIRETHNPEKASTLSRRHRMDDHPEQVEGCIGVHFWETRISFPYTLTVPYSRT